MYLRNIVNYSLIGYNIFVLYKAEVVFTIKVGRCRIQELLDSRGWTQQELANKTGMSKQYINDKIKGRGKHGMWIDSAKIIALALGVHIDDLYEWLPEQEDAEDGG